mmetsp:Transcript_31447/g.58242  ORF Transcript_31447/g.58242 Transcript_31447/m.58242 type:complete len:127 (-) Transcript_31447:238-618(-)
MTEFLVLADASHINRPTVITHILLHPEENHVKPSEILSNLSKLKMIVEALFDPNRKLSKLDFTWHPLLLPFFRAPTKADLLLPMLKSFLSHHIYHRLGCCSGSIGVGYGQGRISLLSLHIWSSSII